MQFFDCDTEVLVERKSSYSTVGLDIVDNISPYIKSGHFNIGWANPTSLFAGDKVLLFDSSRKQFLWQSDIDISISPNDTEWISLSGGHCVGGSARSEEVKGYKFVDKNTSVLYSYSDFDEAVCCTAEELLNIAKKEFLTPRGSIKKPIYVFAFTHNIDKIDKTIAPRSVKLQYQDCKKMNSTIRPAISVGISSDLVLLTRNNEITMF